MRGSQAAQPQELIKGVPVSSGIVFGRVLVLEDDPLRIGRRSIGRDEVAGELVRLDGAVQASIDELDALYKRAQKEMGGEAAKIFEFHKGMLRDRSLLQPIRKLIEADGVSAEYAVSQELARLADKYRALPDPIFATKVNDVEDLAKRIIENLIGDGGATAKRKLSDARGPDGLVIVARDLTPSQVANFDRKKVVGFATDLGGRTSHTAIVASALSIPAVVGCQSLTRAAGDGATIALDGEAGEVVLNPTPATIAEFKRRREARRVFQLELSELASEPSVTADGVAVHVVGNIEFPDEVTKVLSSGGEGVGLYRTEFLHLTRQEEPTEEDHYRAYRRCVELLEGRPLVIRTLDLGADKYTQSREEIPERNPFLGCRSIRYCLRNVPVFKRQLRAILRASAAGPLKIMFPLVTSLSELRHARLIVNDVMEDLAEDGIDFDRDVPIGMMVEVPSAAVMADAFAQECDFFSIGTNDLIQYTLAVDRQNERIASLYSQHHPAVIRLIRETVRAARKRGIEVSCCGESAADPAYAMLLIGLGLRTLSVTSSSIPTLKRFVRSVTIAQCERVARQALLLDSDAQIAVLLRDRARKTVPEAFDGRSAEA